MATRLGENADRCRPPGSGRQARRRRREALPPAGCVAPPREGGGGGGRRRRRREALPPAGCVAPPREGGGGGGRRREDGRSGPPERASPPRRGRTRPAWPRDQCRPSRTRSPVCRPCRRCGVPPKGRSRGAARSCSCTAARCRASPDGVEDRLGRRPCAAVPAELEEGSSSNRRALAVRPARPWTKAAPGYGPAGGGGKQARA